MKMSTSRPSHTSFCGVYYSVGCSFALISSRLADSTCWIKSLVEPVNEWELSDLQHIPVFTRSVQFLLIFHLCLFFFSSISKRQLVDNASAEQSKCLQCQLSLFSKQFISQNCVCMLVVKCFLGFLWGLINCNFYRRSEKIYRVFGNQFAFSLVCHSPYTITICYVKAAWSL